MKCLITRKIPVLKTNLFSFLWAKYSPHKRQITSLTMLGELGALPQGDPPRFTSLSHTHASLLPSRLCQAAVIFFLLLLTFQNIVYFPSGWLMSGKELIQHRHTRQLALGRAILSLCCWQPRARDGEAVTWLAALTAGEECQWQGWDGARSLAEMALALHCKTSAGIGQLHWYPWQALTFYSLKCSPWQTLGADGVKQLCTAVTASNYQL